ncbi:cytochrome c oxidase subunit 3 family protein [Pendulispora brunnea]|uniref:Cytochrome c oxidase subunit 3 family protein n=1 Tax=Pendulispora brunnea TaxID=2905690 RepID=A0ABZ2KIR2_9BACT
MSQAASHAESAPASHDESHEAGHDEHHGPAWLAHHFDTPAQQFDAAKLGMWAFLAQELLFFSGVFVAYGIFRSWYPEAFSSASHQLDRVMGAANTIVLLFSSWTAAMAVRSSQLGKKQQTTTLLLITIACAFIFLIVKYFEYQHKFHAGLLPGKYFGHPVDGGLFGAIPAGHGHTPHLAPKAHIFFSLYFVMTGIHALHVIVGIGVLFWIVKRNAAGEFSKEFFTPVDLVALYWHLVDLIWIYLFPLLYLID